MKSNHDHIKKEMPNPSIQTYIHNQNAPYAKNKYQPRMGANPKAKKENTKPKPYT